MAKFKVGDIVVSNSDKYLYTKKGWSGEVVSISDNGMFKVRGEGPFGIVDFTVDESCFDLVRRSNAVSPFVPFHEPCRILKSGDRTIVFWPDGEKTIVKRAADEPDNDYAAFTAALGIKLFGSNSALKRMIERKTVQQKSKEKKKDTAVQDMAIQTKRAEKAFRAFGEALGRSIREAFMGDEPRSGQPTKSSAE